MKLKNIISMVCFLFLAVSCSMEDDVLNEFDYSQKDQIALSDAKAAVAFKVTLPTGNMTKTVSSGGKEEPTEAECTIDHCSLILADATGAILTVDDQVYVNKTNTFTINGASYDSVVVASSATSEQIIKHMVKVGKVYQVMIIANSNQTFASCTSISAAEEKAQEGFPTSLVKVGRGTIDLTDIDGYSSTTESAEKPVFASVTLYQLSARIELAGFAIKEFIKGTESTDVVINSIQVSNINTKSYLTETAKYGVTAYTSDSKSYENGVTVYTAGSDLNNMYSFIDNKNVKTFYSYRNSANAQNKLKMTIQYTVGGVQKTSKEFVINGTESGGTGSIDSNTIYRLYVTASVTSDELILDNVLCYVKDWNFVEVNVGNLEEQN